MQSQKRKEKKHIDWSRLVLIVIGFGIVWFTHRCLVIFENQGSEPTMLISCVFALCTAEAGILWRIWARKKQINVDSNEVIDGGGKDDITQPSNDDEIAFYDMNAKG